MKYLYLLSQSQTRGYDTYDSCVVCAESEEAAKQINPDGEWNKSYRAWCKTPEDVTIECLGVAKPSLQVGVIISSFNAG